MSRLALPHNGHEKAGLLASRVFSSPGRAPDGARTPGGPKTGGLAASRLIAVLRSVAPSTGHHPPSHRSRADAGEPRWPASIAAGFVAILYLGLPEPLSMGPTILFPVLILLVVVPLTVTSPTRRSSESRALRSAAFAAIALTAAANGASLGLLVRDLLESGRPPLGRELLRAALIVWLANVAVFGLWFWELDRGGPHERAGGSTRRPDFLFPQMSDPSFTAARWRPEFLDYLYVSFTNASAFSPTDTMPVSRWAKCLMALQALTSLVTVVLVTARAVNVLG